MGATVVALFSLRLGVSEKSSDDMVLANGNEIRYSLSRYSLLNSSNQILS
jgi:hypothetical protein